MRVSQPETILYDHHHPKSSVAGKHPFRIYNLQIYDIFLSELLFVGNKRSGYKIVTNVPKMYTPKCFLN